MSIKMVIDNTAKLQQEEDKLVATMMATIGEDKRTLSDRILFKWKTDTRMRAMNRAEDFLNPISSKILGDILNDINNKEPHDV